MRRASLFVGIATVLQGSIAATGPLPPAPPPRPVELSPREARDLIRRQFGLECGDPGIEGDFFFFEVDGYRDPRRNCPMEGIPGMKCGGLEFRPSEARVRREAWIAPVSGHLARNLVVTVSLFSDAVPPSSGTMHGMLVLDRPDPASRKAAFGWYLGREVPPGDVTFQDVTGDGVPDVLYTYEMFLGPFGRVVARDLWTFAGLSAERVISSGEFLAGIFMGSFEGLALWWDGVIDEVTRVRGAFRFEEVRPGAPALGVFERARTGAGGPGMDFWVLGDFGEGWILALAGTDGQQPSGETGDSLDCAAREVPVDAPLEVRRRLIGLETVCRMVLGAMEPGPVPGIPIPRPDRLWAALAARRLGFPILALAVRERLARDLPDRGPGFLLLRGVLALADLSTIIAATDSLWPRAPLDERVENWAKALAHPLLEQAVRGVQDLRTRVESLVR
ncbi:hypothetical protein KBD49_04400 [Myxococcota bacterium]|jgi:hypothetical protein|nr:hypothetical protein [Myxococcota bacterium]